MRRFLLALVACFAFVCAGLACNHAYAVAGAAWPFAEQRAIVVGYGATYVRSAEECVHHGVDIAGVESDEVRACAGGTVRFAGRIPCSGGGSALAVTIELEDARLLTVMPLDSLEVRSGERISSGMPVGTLAAQGDSSYAQPHVHVSVRSGEVYEDPTALLSPPAAPSAEEGQSSTEIEECRMPCTAAAAPGDVSAAGAPLRAGDSASVDIEAPSGFESAGDTHRAADGRAIDPSFSVASSFHRDVFVGQPLPSHPADVRVAGKPARGSSIAAAACRSIAALAALGAAIALPIQLRIRRTVSDQGSTLLQPR